MSFTSARASFVRFSVSGNAPQDIETALQTLSKHSFKETEIGAPDEIEAGWITGEHILDTQFSYEKNGFGNALLFAMRLDTHKVPGEIKNAYKKISQQAAASSNPSGFASKAQKRQATEDADRQVHEDLAAGKFRKSKSIALFWDLKTQILYCASSANKAIEQLAELFRKSFSCELEILTAGALASHISRQSGKGRDYEDLKPSAFTKPPAQNSAYDDDNHMRDGSTPLIPWTIQAVDLKDFLGNEFLFYLWHISEKQEGRVEIKAQGANTEAQVFIAFDKQLDMECGWGLTGKQTLRGDGPTRMTEAGEALRIGKWPRKAGLLISDGEHQWEFTLQADKMIVSSALLPEIPDAQDARELTEARLQLIKQLANTIELMYKSFLEARTSSGWQTRRTEIGKWIQARK